MNIVFVLTKYLSNTQPPIVSSFKKIHWGLLTFMVKRKTVLPPINPYFT